MANSDFYKRFTNYAGALCLAYACYPLLRYGSLPDLLSIHFNALGKADSWGGREVVWIIPLVAVILCGVFTWIEKILRPLHFSYQVSPENPTRQYQQRVSMFRTLKLIIALTAAWSNNAIASAEVQLQIGIILSIIAGLIASALFLANIIPSKNRQETPE